ncbi:MAG: hypothetical protein JXO72_05915 [Vicinamibacteria bacterium]|nr:hypothetical protein [Vicinamibacteria bacterium]
MRRAATKEKRSKPEPSSFAVGDKAPERTRIKTAARAKPRCRESAARSRRLPQPADQAISPPSAQAAALENLSDRLTMALHDLALSIHDLPSATDFQPLADHLYEFARAAPDLLAALRSLPPLITSLEQAAPPLREAVETLLSTQASLADALFHMPRPTEYEPLAEPLREFARRSPPLLAALEAMPRTAALLESRLQSLEHGLEAGSSARLHAYDRDSKDACGIASQERLRAVDGAVREAREAIRTALDSLPREPDYAPVARQLKELATVSPSLLDWLSEIPRLSLPLGDSVRKLQEAVSLLAAASDLLAAALDDRDEN